MNALYSVAARLLPATRSGRLLTLIYHRVRDRPDPMFPGEVTAEQFDWQIGVLRRYCTPLALADAVQALAAGSLPSRAVAVTFDDGYADNASVALPILLRHGVPATFFIATSFLDGGIMWNDRVIESVRGARVPSLAFPGLGIGALVLGSDQDRTIAAESMICRIKHLPSAERGQWVDAICAQCAVELPGDLMMSRADVRRLHAAGMEIGAHTQHHPILSTLPAEAARSEIAGSRAELEAMIGGAVSAFAYPNGRPGEDYGLRERDMVASLGFRYAAATRWGAAHSGTDIYQLPRFTPWDRTPARWLARLLLQFRNAV